MAVFKIIYEKDSSLFHASTNHFYNGLLSEFVDNDSEYTEYHALFARLLAVKENLHVCTDLPVKINHKTISNQIIRYKDSFKLPEGYLRVPLMLYWEDGEQERAIAFSKTTYIEAKGCYYCMTEPDTEFSECRNEILALCLNEKYTEDIFRAFNEMVEGKRAVGAIQRYYDHRYLENVDEMKDECVRLSTEIFDEAKKHVIGVEERNEIIYAAILRAFLIKKALYVQYMMSKDLLTNRHEGDVKKQRQFAKAYSDEVPIVSLSALWRYGNEEQENKEAE